ncbi:MAG: glycosyltransferase family 39 protein [Bacteroides graminisolvens]|nr:glycosyltransferase family 39 protein [Bacteroides graminisolvens]
MKPIMISDQIKHLALLLLVCFFSFFVHNDFIPADLMESRNLATAQEMVALENYLAPTMNGELRLEKPPLPTWIAACVNHIKPHSLSAQRYAAGVAATLMVIFLYLVVRQLSKNSTVSLVCALILATCYNVIMMGRTATWDIYCHSFMLGAIFFFIKALSHEGPQWRFFVFTGLFMGLSFLSKGPVSFFALLIPFIIAYLVTWHPSFKGKMKPIIAMILVCLMVSFWWPVYIYIFHRDWGVHIANKESSSWLNHNVRPWYYYWQFPAEAGIWALFWVTSLVWPYWRKRFSQIHLHKIYLFSILWTVVSLILLSLIPEKKTRYLLPLLIPGAINVGLCLYYYLSGRLILSREKRLFRINMSLILLVILALPVALYLFFVQKQELEISLFAMICFCCFLLALLLAWSIYNRRVNYKIALGCVIGTMLVVEGLCFIPAGKLFINNERHSISEVRKIPVLQHLPFYYVEGEELRIELVYESDRVIRPLNIRNMNLVESKLPFVLVSATPADSVLDASKWEIDEIGRYDNNWQKTNSRKYNPDLVRYVSVLRIKSTDSTP